MAVVPVQVVTAGAASATPAYAMVSPHATEHSRRQTIALSPLAGQAAAGRRYRMGQKLFIGIGRNGIRRKAGAANRVRYTGQVVRTVYDSQYVRQAEVGNQPAAVFGVGGEPEGSKPVTS